MPGRLSTHVLDIANGRPAQGLRIDLFRLAPDGGRSLVKSAVTNADGRTAEPLLLAAGPDESLATGQYELLFHVADYFAGVDAQLPDPPFLDQVPIRFGLADPQGHYHVPLLVAPWGYNTYRGS